MFRFLIAVALAALVLPTATHSAAGQKLVIRNSESGGITTTISAVDYARRTVTLTGPRGNRVTLPAGPDVGGLEGVRVGDTVAISFILRQELAVYPGKGSGPVRRGAGSFTADTAEFASNVISVDARDRYVWLRGPAGGAFRVVIARDVPGLEQLRPGDRVMFRETTILTGFGGGPPADDVKVGVLLCQMSPTIGLIIGSQQNLACTFMPDRGGPAERYAGSIGRIGLDIGITAGGQMAWAVYAPTTGIGPGGLAGSYVGASADVSLGVGVGANLLVGGSSNTAALQPLSVEGQIGANLALGVANLTLWPAP
jgi:hypothetical protein